MMFDLLVHNHDSDGFHKRNSRAKLSKTYKRMTIQGITTPRSNLKILQSNLISEPRSMYQHVVYPKVSVKFGPSSTQRSPEDRTYLVVVCKANAAHP